MEIVVDTLKNRYAKFTGRAGRREYWMFVLAYILAAIAAMIVGRIALGASGGQFLYTLVVLAALIPSLALGFRRLHDIDKSAWWLLIGLIPLIGGLVLLYFAVKPGTVGPNQYGPDPKETSTDVAATFS
jgi:uncharacterized membrane protein YhaH (DUF805 family)